MSEARPCFHFSYLGYCYSIATGCRSLFLFLRLTCATLYVIQRNWIKDCGPCPISVIDERYYIYFIISKLLSSSDNLENSGRTWYGTLDTLSFDKTRVTQLRTNASRSVHANFLLIASRDICGFYQSTNGEGKVLETICRCHHFG